MGLPSTADAWPPPQASGHQDVPHPPRRNFVEAQSNKITLADTEPQTFDAVQTWLYSHRLHPAKVSDPSEMSVIELAKLWVFGDAHNVPALQNVTIDLLHQTIVHHRSAPRDLVKYIYTNTVAGAPLRLSCIDIIAWLFKAEGIFTTPTDSDDFPKEALVDLLKVVWDIDHQSLSERSSQLGFGASIMCITAPSVARTTLERT